MAGNREKQCSVTRGFILSTLRGGATLNQNQIATLLGLDRTVVHRAIKSVAKEGLVSERRAKSGRAIHVQLTRKGNKYRERLIKVRVAADEKVRHQLTPEERATLLRLLKLIAELEFLDWAAPPAYSESRRASVSRRRVGSLDSMMSHTRRPSTSA